MRHRSITTHPLGDDGRMKPDRSHLIEAGHNWLLELCKTTRKNLFLVSFHALFEC